MMAKFQDWYVINKDMIRQNVGVWTQRVVSGLQTAMQSLGRFWWGLGKIADGVSSLFKKLTGSGFDLSKLQVLAGLGAVLARIFAPVYFTIAAVLLLVDDFLGYLKGDKSVFGAFVQMIKELTGASEGLAAALAGIVASLGLLALMKPGLLLGGLGKMFGVGENSASPGGAKTPSGPGGAGVFAGIANALGLSAAVGALATFVQSLGDTPGDAFDQQVESQKQYREGLEKIIAAIKEWFVGAGGGDAPSRGGPLSRSRRDRGEIERERSLDDYLDGPQTTTGSDNTFAKMLAAIDNIQANLAKQNAGAAAATVPTNDNRDQSTHVNVGGVQVNVQSSTSAPAAVGAAVGSAVGRAAVPQAGRLAIDSAF